MRPARLLFVSALFCSASFAVEAQKLPAQYAARARSLGCNKPTDFDLAICARNVIGTRCSSIAASYGQCAEGADVAKLGRLCVGASSGDAGLASAFAAFDKATAAAARKKACTKNLQAGTDKIVTKTTAKGCNPYDPNSPRGTWNSQVKASCNKYKGLLDSFKCAKYPAGTKSHTAAMQAVQSGKVGIQICQRYTASGQAGAASDGVCKAAGMYIYANSLCSK